MEKDKAPKKDQPKQPSASQDIARAIKSGDIPAEAVEGFRELSGVVDRWKGRR